MVALVFCALTSSALAQEGQSWKWQFSTRYAASGTKSVKEQASELGAFRTDSVEYDLRRRVYASGRYNLSVGANFERISLRHDPQAALPDHLQSVTGALMGGLVFNRKSWLTVTLNPGFYGDDQLLAQDFNMPGSVVYHRLYRTDLHLLGGLSIDLYRKSPVIPFVGALWRASERWNFRLTLPKLSVEYRAYLTPEATVDLFTGLAFSGGNYRVSPELGRLRGRHAIGGQILSFSQQEVLAGVRAAGAGLEGEIYGGWAYSRRLEYARAGIVLESNGAPTVGVSLIARF